MYRKLVLPGLVALLLIISGCTTAPVDQSPAELTSGTLAITSTPPGSEIYLDGSYRGTTPLTISDVPIGSHTLELRAQEYTSWSTSLDIEGDSKVSLNATLSPIVVIPTSPTPIPTTEPIPEQPSVVGCWRMEFVKGGGIHAYLLELQSGGTGRLSVESISESVTWSQDSDSAMVHVSYVSPYDPTQIHHMELDYNEDAGTLTDRDIPSIPYVRVPC